MAAPRYHVQEIGERRVIEFEQRDVAEAWKLEGGRTQQVAEGMDRIQVEPNELVTFRLQEAARRVEPVEVDWWEAWEAADPVDPAGGTGVRPTMSAELWSLPYQIVGLDAAAEELNLEPVVHVDGGGLRPQSSGGFLGRIFAGVRDLARPAEQRALPTAIEILVTAEVDSVTPRMIRLERTNQWTQVELAAASPADPVVVRLVPTFDPQGTQIEVPVVRGGLHLTISPKTIQGLGLETAQVTVRTTGLPGADGKEVVLSADRGRLDENQLVLSPSGVASTSIRSVTIGTTTVTAAASAMAPAEASARFLFPWLFLIAAVVGGAVGALIRWARTEEDRRRSLLVEIFVLGVLSGLVVAAAYSVGINLLGLQATARAGEGLIFVLSALGAYFGLPSRG